MIDRIFSFFDWVVSFFSDLGTTLLDTLWLVINWAFEQIVDGLNGFLHWIPVPDFVNKAGGFLHNIPPEVTWFLKAVAFNEGLAMVMLAYVLRFILRRIPLIG